MPAHASTPAAVVDSRDRTRSAWARMFSLALVSAPAVSTDGSQRRGSMPYSRNVMYEGAIAAEPFFLRDSVARADDELRRLDRQLQDARTFVLQHVDERIARLPVVAPKQEDLAVGGIDDAIAAHIELARLSAHVLGVRQLLLREFVLDDPPPALSQ